MHRFDDGGDIYDKAKHWFVHMSLHADWHATPLQIDVNTTLMMSVNTGAWRGTAKYIHTEESGGQWKLLFHYKANIQKCKKDDLHADSRHEHVSFCFGDKC